MDLQKTTTLLLLFAVLVPPALAQDSGASLGGYGELHYNDNLDDDESGQLDFHRFILFAGYEFNDWISFHSELEVEHTLVEVEAEEEDGELELEEAGEVAIEQAYVDLNYHPNLGVRGGLILIPVGIINPVHEPPTFHGVERPAVERFIIPSTWRESGAGIFGRFRNGLSYEAYLMAGLEAGEIGAGGIRDARQNGFRSSTENLAFTSRLDYRASLSLTLGASYYYSGLTARDEEDGTVEEVNGGSFNLVEAHAIYERSGLQARGLIAYSLIPDAATLNDELGHNVGESQLGAYAELAYDILGLFAATSPQQLSPFVRYEYYNTQQSMPDGFSANPALERQDLTLGLTYKPHPQVALKADIQIRDDATDDDRADLFNLGIGYNF